MAKANSGRKTVEAIAVLFVMLAILPCCKSKPKLALDKTKYKQGETITVTFTAPSSYKENAWVGVIPSNTPHGSEATNDQVDVTYQYLQKRASGTLTFTAPEAGSWDMRMHDTDDSGKEVASISFVVEAPERPPLISTASFLKLDKAEYAPGETITVTFTADTRFAHNAWIGIIPSHVPHRDEATNDQYDLAYQYMKKQAQGTMTFTAPQNTGSYDMRMHDTDDNGREVFTLTFTVK